MPKKKKKSAYKFFIYATVLAAACFLSFIGYLWWESRQLKTVRYKEFGISIPAGYEIHGIDVSRYQQHISWEAVSAMKVADIQLQFAFMKATEGNGSVDAFFKRNWKKAKETGMHRGAYHFFLPHKDGRMQAKNFIKNVKLQKGDLPPVLDIEAKYSATTNQIRKEAKVFLDVLEEYYGVKPIIYTNISFYKNYLQGHFDDYPLWIAHYLQPTAPRINREWIFWQHSEEGRVDGILSKVDFNVFNGDSTAFQSLLVP